MMSGEQRGQRTKHCGKCRTLLEWEATYCPHCGAGKTDADWQAEALAEAEAEFGRRPRWLPPWGWMVASLAIAAAVIAVALAMRGKQEEEVVDEESRQRRVQQLRQQETELGARIETLSKTRNDIEDKAEAKIRVAAMQKDLEDDDAAARTKDEAAQLFGEANELATSIGALKDELTKVQLELLKLSPPP